MSDWQQFDLTSCVRQLLQAHLPHPTYGGRPFQTAYQLALELNIQFPQVAASLGLAIGGQDQGPYALTTYLASELAHRIRRGEIPDIEISFLAGNHLNTIRFCNMTPTTHDLTMFRFIDR